MSRNDDYMIQHLLNYSYYQNYCKLISIYLSIQTSMTISHQINFIGKLEVHDGAKKLFIVEKHQTNCSKLFFEFINFNRIL